VLMSFFLFICLSSLALPPLNGFIGEFLILIGAYQQHHVWASWAASGAVLSAIYLLWAYQRVALGEVTVERNNTLPDASRRERVILATMAIAILFMGIASPLFTRRMEASTDVLLQNMQQQMNQPQNAGRPAALPSAAPAGHGIAASPEKLTTALAAVTAGGPGK
jgi:NADH-quinone oxidoreductase subunit M